MTEHVLPVQTDVDIDVANRDKTLEGLSHISAGIMRNGVIEKHPTGVYFQNVPRNPLTNVANIDHRDANNYGYFKIDMLNVNMYSGIRDEAHLTSLLEKEPPWDFFQYTEITDQLFHLSGHSDLLRKFKPKSADDLAVILAIIRPSKAHLRRESWDNILSEVWVKHENDAYQFRRCHALAYALAIIVNLNLLVETMLADDSS